MRRIGRKEKFVARTLLFTVTALGIAACTRDEGPESLCLSPAAVSGLYPGDRTEGVTDDQATWRLGAVITNNSDVQQPDAYRGMVIGFNDTAAIEGFESRGHEYLNIDNLSRPVSSEHNEYLVKIGPGDVTFTARKLAESGSQDCNQAPEVGFGPAKPLEEIFASGSPGPAQPDWS